ncbi:hypothetical protein TAMA11512_16660 [Selenomonas sp. TAMA-11512]|uniref:AtpZ/AtpI family protein n=1 Tax=Selenomonas sp. TAMA-11512 TaxID=3095337 RepID=UPI0030903B87|nr:hypothetical protein TAMA11512_16660 [Selenomonas sp. TAMA-11512]
MRELKPPKSPLRQALEAYMFLGGIGFYLVAVLGICVFLGHLADEFFALGSTGKMAGIFAGFPVAIYSAYRKIKEKRL